MVLACQGKLSSSVLVNYICNISGVVFVQQIYSVFLLLVIECCIVIYSISSVYKGTHSNSKKIKGWKDPCTYNDIHAYIVLNYITMSPDTVSHTADQFVRFIRSGLSVIQSSTHSDRPSITCNSESRTDRQGQHYSVTDLTAFVAGFSLSSLTSSVFAGSALSAGMKP